MNILWITNTIFPAPSEALGRPAPVVGGWMYDIAKRIAAEQGIQLGVAATYNGLELKILKIDGVVYYLLPAKTITRYLKHLEPVWNKVCKEFNPDIVHIHGTEYIHGLACMRACPLLNYVISIQGLVGVYSRYYYAGISCFDILKNITFRDIVRFDTLFQGKNKFEQRGIFEKEYLRRTRHVIGRTNWDLAHAKNINPSVNYHFCNETLRDGFYTAPKWDINNKTDYTIFLSQANYPVKGLHQVLKAVAILKTDFPKIKVRVAGPSIINNNEVIAKIKLSGYGSYIRRLIKKLNLSTHVEFTGSLTAEQMIVEYRNAHLFICPSSIENSPNSLGEAQLLGVPVIASYVGGTPDMVIHGETGLLYRFEEVEMLTLHIRKLFTDTDLALSLSANGIRAAESRHNRQNNLAHTLDIYRKLSL